MCDKKKYRPVADKDSRCVCVWGGGSVVEHALTGSVNFSFFAISIADSVPNTNKCVERYEVQPARSTRTRRIIA